MNAVHKLWQFLKSIPLQCFCRILATSPDELSEITIRPSDSTFPTMNAIGELWRLLKSVGLQGFCRLLVTSHAKLRERAIRQVAEIRSLDAEMDRLETVSIEIECKIALIKHERERADWWKTL